MLWRREMLAGSYVPRWLDLWDEGGARFGSAIAFTVDPLGDQYAGDLAKDAVVAAPRLCGRRVGKFAADYLFRTCASLRAEGIPDAELDRPGR